jgi:hypothetical protein
MVVVAERIRHPAGLRTAWLHLAFGHGRLAWAASGTRWRCMRP